MLRWTKREEVVVDFACLVFCVLLRWLCWSGQDGWWCVVVLLGRAAVLAIPTHQTSNERRRRRTKRHEHFFDGQNRSHMAPVIPYTTWSERLRCVSFSSKLRQMYDASFTRVDTWKQKVSNVDDQFVIDFFVQSIDVLFVIHFLYRSDVSETAKRFSNTRASSSSSFIKRKSNNCKEKENAIDSFANIHPQDTLFASCSPHSRLVPFRTQQRYISS